MLDLGDKITKSFSTTLQSRRNLNNFPLIIVINPTVG
jgi:hypothetical protein